LSGFGSLRVMQRKSRVGRNPRDGSRIDLAPSRYVTFRPSRTVDF
jgi:nucleoid DNA-binding protein